MRVTLHKTEKARKLGGRYLLHVFLVNRQTGRPAPSIWWETRTQVEAHEVLLTILSVYNQASQPDFVEYATIENSKGKQVFARNLRSIFTH